MSPFFRQKEILFDCSLLKNMAAKLRLHGFHSRNYSLFQRGGILQAIDTDEVVHRNELIVPLFLFNRNWHFILLSVLLEHSSMSFFCLFKGVSRHEHSTTNALSLY